MTRNQSILIGFSVLLFLGLYFGAKTKTSEIKTAEKTRALNSESTDIGALLMDAKPDLTPLQTAELFSLEDRLSKANEDTTLISVYKDIASTWYKNKRADISGYYAVKVAELEDTEDAWSIAGTTMLLGLKNASKEKIKKFCSQNAVKAFENAISLNPDNVQHRTNLAICYAEYPSSKNPMQGIMMLLELNKEYPENVGVLLTLARFGMQTNQFEKVEGRLQKVLSIEPDNKAANCLMVEALAKLDKLVEAGPYQAKCSS
jgi:tetratricopeptide (TPR) repeat protein